MKYILSSNINLSTELINGIECYYLDSDSKKNKTFKINKSIYDFTLCFKEKTTFLNVLKRYKDKLEIKSDENYLALEKVLNIFFNQLISEEVLIKEGKEVFVFNRCFLFEKNNHIGNHIIIDFIANNKITDVYLTKYRNSFFVIKLVNPAKIASKPKTVSYNNLLKLEHSFLDKFKSKYINKTYGFHSTENFDYIVLEYIKGLSISKFIKKNRPKIKERESIVIEILKAFSMIHKKNVYHGDIHFGNILVTEKGKIKIIDFGLSNNVTVSDLEVKYNIRKRNGGVYYFIPPERLIVNGNFKRKFTAVKNFSAEVYQIGLICYFIFFYTEVFSSETWNEHIQDKLNFSIEKDRNFIHRKRLNKFHKLIIKSLNTDPAKRFKDAQEMLKFVTQK